MGAGVGPIGFGPCPLLFEVNKMLHAGDPRVQRDVRNRERIQAELKAMERRKIVPHRPAHEVLHDGSWRGERAFLIGGGPSLEGFDFERLRGKGRVIAINRAFEFAPFADVLFFMDNRFYLRYHGKDLISNEKWNAFPGVRVFLNLSGRKYDDVYSVRKLGKTGLSNSIRAGIYHGNNSGVGAINLAYALGASPIYLLGYDCKFNGKKSHFHSGYNILQHEGSVRSFAKEFDRLNRYLKRTSARVFNLNPHSGCKAFPFGNLEEVLDDGQDGKDMGHDGSDPLDAVYGDSSARDQEGRVLLDPSALPEVEPLLRSLGPDPGPDLEGRGADA
jgi:hypothetical protein